jgi:hypothetical protein
MAMKRTILRRALISGFLLISLFLFVSPFSFASELDEIRAAIEKKGAKWTATETSISYLPPELRRLRVRLIKAEITGTESIISLGPPPLGLPATIASGSSGSGNGSVGYSVSSNTTSKTITGTITVAGKHFTVKQNGP